MAETLDDFLARIEGQESGGNPNARNARTGAYGRFQIMPSNWAPWAKEAGLGSGAAKTPQNQETVARFKMQQYYQQFGSWDAVAVAWYAGPGAAAAWVKNPDTNRFNRKQGAGNEPSINEYVAAIRGRKPSSGFGGKFGGGSGLALEPVPNEKPMTDEEIRAAIRRKFGYLAAYINDPEVGPILIQAAKDDWDDATMMGELSKTKLWKTTSAQTRLWDAKWRTDTATARQEVAARQQDIGQQAQQLGVTLTPARSRELAINMLRLGWTADQVQDALAAEFDYQPGKSTGVGGGTAETIRKLAGEYLVPTSNQRLEEWTRDVLSGAKTADNVKEELTAQAKSLFPHLSQSLDRGETVRQFADPYVQIAAKRLGVSPDTIDLTDTKWLRPLVQMDEKGNRVPMGLDQWERELRTNDVYGYSKTAEAMEASAGFAQSLAKTFGRSA